MKAAKRYVITTETRETVVVRRVAAERGFCPACEMDVEMLSFDGAVTRSGFRSRDLLRMFNSGEVHSIESAEGYLLACASSLEEGKRG